MKRFAVVLVALFALPAHATEKFSAAQGAVVTAGQIASLVAIPSTMLNEPRAAVHVRVVAAANAAFSLSGTAVAPSSTVSASAIPVLGGFDTVFHIPVGSTALSYVRIGSSDATVYLTFGYLDR